MKMKARLVPVYFMSGRNEDFDRQLSTLNSLLSDVADFLDPVSLGSTLPEADAVVFPQLLGDAFKQIGELKKIDLPLVVVTSEFGTVAMWDWEIVSFLKAEGLKTFAPYNLDLTKAVCKSLAVKRDFQHTKFLVFQDNPGEGFQADIFKRFYWWEERCTGDIKKKFGVSIEKKSFKEFGEAAKQISDQEAREVWKNWNLETPGVSDQALNSAIKIYIAVKRELAGDPAIKGVGINCLNESHFSDTTPCLAWNMLFEESGILWACEADTITLITKYLVHKSLDVPIMMSNVYPQLVGQAALKHEKIERFPEVPDPENHLLIVHCGFLGVLPKSWATEWNLRPKVLAIVDENATAIDARLPTGDITLTKLDHTFNKLMSIKGELVEYVQYPGSDCRNGAVVKIRDGHALMNSFYSHHILLVTGHWGPQMTNLAQVFDLELEEF
jgi:hypothetical protein